MDRPPEDRALLTVDDVREIVAGCLLPGPAVEGPGRVGVESEHFGIAVGRGGHPRGRVSLDWLTALLDDHPQLDPEPPNPRTVTGWRTHDGSRIVPEPGAQVEYAGVPTATAAEAIDGLRRTVADLASLFATRGAALVSAGMDLWHPAVTIPQQLNCPRYPAMNAYFGRRTHHGHTMMTSTASLQVNLDLGSTPDMAVERWRTALLASPLATAAFACSPTPGAVSGRALAWQWLDPTRTGVPAAFVEGVDDPVETLTRAAMQADVMLFHTPEGIVAGEPGFSFETWLREGHPVHGHPDDHAATYHLTTLFPEVRARGFLEIRSIDALPDRWRVVPIVLFVGLLYDDRARRTAEGLLEPYRQRLPELLSRAAHVGVADPRLCALAVEVWTAAAEGARRLPPGYLDPADIARAESFLDRFTLRGRSPSDELRERFADGPDAALAWASEPLASLQQLC